MPNGLVPSASVPTLTLGGMNITNVLGLIIAGGYCGGGNKTVARKPSAAAGYTPSGAKAFRVKIIRLISPTATSAAGAMAYCDTDVGLNSASALVNGVFMHGDVSNYISSPAIAGGECIYVVDFLVPNTKFLAYVNSAAAAAYCLYYGLEE